jgi:uncharacterized membrane protein
VSVHPSSAAPSHPLAHPPLPSRIRAISALLFSIALLSLPWLVRLDGKPHADWQQFLGRFHPLAVHLPIGLLVLVPILELAGIRRSVLREAVALVLGLAFLSSLAALALGYLLAYGSGQAGSVVTLHLWGGIALVIGVLLSMLARPAWVSGSSVLAYPILLICTLLALVWTAHQGGSITHGGKYLTQYMPAPLKRLLPDLAGSDATEPSNPASFYTRRIQPIFDANCVSCHGESKKTGGLRLDSYNRLMRGGNDGAVIIPGNPDRSILLHRVTLPPGDKLFMPSEGKPPLHAEEIAWIRAWIQQGASPTDTAVAGVSIHEPQPSLPDPPLMPVGDYTALEPRIRQLQAGQGAKLLPVSSKPSDGLILETVNIAGSFSDAQLRDFEAFAPYIVEADLGRTAITDASFDTLARFTHLRALHLEGTAISGTGLARLAPLTQLTYLNLSSTRVTSAAIAPLASMKQLRHIYLFNTPAQPAPATDSPPAATRSTP